MMEKKFWRCNVCNDIHYGIAGPEICPTCSVKYAYVESNEIEAKYVLDLCPQGTPSDLIPEEKLLKMWEKFTEKNDFKLNPKKDQVDKLAKGVSSLEKSTGLRLCPCRLGDGSKERNLELLCPCNFKIQEAWKKKEECWCGLFVKGAKG